MANDSIEIIDNFDYHPCNTPRGCLYYDIKILTPEQQTHLNALKTKMMREDEKYLNKNPEVRAFVALIIRYVLKLRPRQNIHKVVKNFFNRPRSEIEAEVYQYVEQHGKPVCEEEMLEEEEGSAQDALMDYYKAMRRIDEQEIEEEMPTKTLRRSSTEEFIRGLLIERIYQMPSSLDLRSSKLSDRQSELEADLEIDEVGNRMSRVEAANHNFLPDVSK